MYLTKQLNNILTNCGSDVKVDVTAVNTWKVITLKQIFSSINALVIWRDNWGTDDTCCF